MQSGYYLLVFALVITTSTSASKSTRIIGGFPAVAGQFPFAAAIHVQTNDSKFFCGGTLIGSDWVITAGHCVYQAVIFTIQVGSNQLESADGNRITVATSAYFLHPGFNPDSIENDIGLIRFRSPVAYNVYLMPATLLDHNLPDNSQVYILGWGQTSDTNSSLSNDLKYSYVATITTGECQIYYGNQITEQMVCVAGNYNEGACTGDNGGGLIFINGRYLTLVGVASFISGNGCESTNPSGYTRIWPYIEWIRNMTASE